MNLIPTEFAGHFVVETTPHVDIRGGFARTFCRTAFRAAGIDLDIVEASISTNPTAGTLRGLHWQAGPHGETKVVQVVAGAVYDVVVDLRPGSATSGAWCGYELSAASGRGLCIPPGCAHGFLTLTPETVVSYAMSTPHVAHAARGVRWDDPAFAIDWPSSPTVISDRDAHWPAWRVATPQPT